MLLTSLTEPSYGWRIWQESERYLGGGTRTYSRYADDSQIDPQFHPQWGRPSFEVPTFWVRHGDAGEYLTGQLPSALHAHYRDGDRFLLPVHPEALREPTVAGALAGCPDGPPLRVVPSANARTVFVLSRAGDPVPPHFVKLHYPFRLSRFTRRLRRPVIALQLWVAEEMAAIRAPLLPEVAGGVIGADPAQAWGFVLREAGVRGAPPLPYTIPLFALYGHDIRHEQHPTLLEQLIVHSGEAPQDWVNHRLVAPMVALWTDTLLRTGCAIEPHGQNTLLSLSADLRTTRIGYRDCAVYVDPQLRRQRGLSRPLPPRNVISHDVAKPREQVFSLVYDAFMGHHALAFVARLLQNRFGVAPAILHKFAHDVFASAAAGSADLLPQTVHYYDDALHADGRWELVDTGEPPQWR